MEKQFTIDVEQESNPKEGFSAFCRELSGCFSNGETKEEALKNMREAIIFHLDSFNTVGTPKIFIEGSIIPKSIKFLQDYCFVPLRKSDSHLTIFKTIYEGKRPIRNVMITFPIHKIPELGRKLILRILKEAGCKTDEFLGSDKFLSSN